MGWDVDGMWTGLGGGVTRLVVGLVYGRVITVMTVMQCDGGDGCDGDGVMAAVVAVMCAWS